VTNVIDISIVAAGWRRILDDPRRLARRVAAATLAATKVGNTADTELSIVLTDDPAMRRLNRDYRGRDRTTNVLSFPAENNGPGHATGPRLLGDVILALETVEREAEAAGLEPSDHAAHLIVHGILHLLGYDHATDAEAAVMERLESRILSHLNIADPYAVPRNSMRSIPGRTLIEQ